LLYVITVIQKFKYLLFSTLTVVFKCRVPSEKVPGLFATIATLAGWDNIVVGIFGKQFTIDDIYDGLDADKLMPTIMKCLTDVAGKIGAKLSELPNARTGL